ncbi:fumarylacetoacetate hydrolase family protein [Staphylococcus epidermidis]|uniref:fumarylacetoacetate hydrolase family protein n=1 Tax=Staphylococcus epidermidis TaxID=1282 RepID=UPI00138AD011
MKFLSFKHNDRTSYGVKVKREDAVWDLPMVFAEFGDKDFNPKTLIAGLQQNQTLDFQEQVRKAVVAAEESGRDEEFKFLFTDIDFLPPVTPPNNVIAFGRNYEDHASELNHEVDSLYVFTKAASSLTGDEATIPNHKDITDRTAQSSHDQAFLSKSLTGACPMGPYIVTKDELPTPENVNIVTKVNNEIRQDGNTGEMILKIDELIEKISKYVALHPGDIIATGTPAGVGAGLQPPQFLQPGDEVKVTIDNIGTLTTYISKN